MRILLTLPQVQADYCPFSEMHINRMIAAGKFPKPIRLSTEKNARKFWDKAELDAWIEARAAARDADLAA